MGGAITNTVLFLGSFFLLVGAPYAAAKGISVEAVGLMIMGIVTANGIPEALVSGVIVVPIVMALEKSRMENEIRKQAKAGCMDCASGF